VSLLAPDGPALTGAAGSVLLQCLGLRAGESVLVVEDRPNTVIGGTVDVPFHADGIITGVTLVVDNVVLIDAGRPMF